MSPRFKRRTIGLRKSEKAIDAARQQKG